MDTTELLLREILTTLKERDSGPDYATITVRHPRALISRIQTALGMCTCPPAKPGYTEAYHDAACPKARR